METKINWAAAFTINEPLHEFASEISGAYARMRLNSEDFTDIDFNKLGFSKNDFKPEDLHQMALEWRKYENRIGEMEFKSEEEGDAEVTRLATICKEQVRLSKLISDYKYGSGVK